MSKKISFAELKTRVAGQGWELLTTETQWQNLSSKSRIWVRSPGGYKQLRPASAFTPGALPVSCQYERSIRKGETVAVLIAAELLAVEFTREYIPACLKPFDYQLDGWAEFDHPAGSHVRLALEHQGDHRNNPNAPVHAHKGGAEVSMAAQAARDANLARLLKEDGIALALVPDLLAKTTRWVVAVDTVAQSLEAALPFVRDDDGYQARKAKLLSGETRLSIPDTWRQAAQEQVQRALDRHPGEGHALTVVRCDPVERLVTLSCAKHGELDPVAINNVLGSVDGTRPGTRCPKCANELNGAKRRLTADEIVAAASAAGFRALFDLDTYEGNQQVLPWECLKDGSHTVRDTLSHLIERGCPACREEKTAGSRREREFDQIRTLVEERGDTLLSSLEDYVDQHSRIRFRCSLCGSEATQRAVKIKLGQRHGCQRVASSIATRRAVELQHLKAEVMGLGIEVLTAPENYLGNRNPVQFTVSGQPGTRQAAPYLLRQWAKRGRIPPQ